MYINFTQVNLGMETESPRDYYKIIKPLTILHYLLKSPDLENLHKQ